MKLPYLPALVAALLAASSVIAIRAEDGYRLWLRYDRIADDAQRTAYAAALGHVVLATPAGA